MSRPATPRGPLTEGEARCIGQSAQRLANLRDLLAKATGGSLTVRTPQNSTVTVTLSSFETIGALALLAEREAAFLSSFDVQVEPYQ